MKFHAAQVADRERASELLTRYPKVSDEEAGEILQFLRGGRHLDIGLVSSRDGLRPKLDSFIEDPQEHFRLNWREGAAWVGGILVALVTAFLIWGAFAEAAMANAGTT